MTLRKESFCGKEVPINQMLQLTQWIPHCAIRTKSELSCLQTIVTDRMDAMDRLACLLLMLMSAAGSTYAQDNVARYSVAGDVSLPQTYQYSSQTPVHLRDLLAKAGAIDAGNALVVRGTPLTLVGNEYVDVKGGLGGFVLTPGDIVVFRSQLGRIPNRANALVLLKDCRAELPLPDGFRSVSGLLRQLNLATSQISATRTDSSNCYAMTLSDSEAIIHADVIDLSSVAFGDLSDKGQFEVLPTSETARPSVETNSVSGSLVVRPVSESVEHRPVELESPESTPLVQMQLVPAETDGESATEDHGPFRIASLENVVESSPPIPAIAMVDSKTLNADPAGSFVLNSIFIAGLLFAMGLILVGWVRTKREQEIEQQLPQSITASVSPGEDSVTRLPTDVSKSAIVSDDSPILSVGLEDVTTESSHADVVDGDSWYAEADVPHSEAIPVDESETANQTAKTAATQQWDELEDLIQNRLPVELRQADLPLKVVLFGKPEGPKRLRVDAAHSQIAAPHMVSRQRMRGRQPANTTTASASRKPDQQSTSQKTETSINPLDKALNFLEEQSDS